MNILLDTHIAIWALNDSPDLSKKAREIIANPTNNIYYSTVSVWEVLLKHARKPHNIPFDEIKFQKSCQKAGFYPLSLSDKHVLEINTLIRSENTKEHNDPFDRLLIAQAKSEGFYFLTQDELIAGYDERHIIFTK